MHRRLCEHREQLQSGAVEVVLNTHVGGGKPLAPGVGAGGLLQQRQAGDGVWREFTGWRNQRRAADRNRCFGHQVVGLGAGPVAIAEVNGRIKLCISKQERPRAVGQVDRDLRMLAEKVTEPWQ